MRVEFTVNDNDKETKLAIRALTYEDQEEANRVYSAKIASLLREKGNKKLLLRQELDNYLREAGIWTDVDQTKINNLYADIESLLGQLKKGGQKLSTGREICIKIIDKRKEIVQVTQKRQIFDNVTIEASADNERLDYIVYICTVYAENGEQYWQSFEDMKNDKSSNVYEKAYLEVMKNVFGIDAEYEKSLPENKWLKKYSFINNNLEYTDRKTGEKVDVTGRPVQELEKEIERKIELLQGDIVEEQPFVDDETNEPIKV